MDSEAQRRHNRRIASIRTGKAWLMNDSKWQKIFNVVFAETGQQFAKAKMLGDERMYDMRLEIYSEDLRGYSDDWIAGPLKLSEIEYIETILPPDVCAARLTQAIRGRGQYEFEIKDQTLTIYGYL